MKISHFILILSCVLGTSCAPTNLRFPREETLTPVLMPLHGITNPFKVQVKYPFLVVQNLMNDSIFHIYDLATYELKSAFGTKGEGPGEFIIPMLEQTTLPYIIIQDKHAFHYYDIDNVGQSFHKYSKEPKCANELYGEAIINDSLFLIDALYTGPDIYLFNFLDELPKKKWQYRNPDMLDYYADPNMGNVYANEKRIVFCYGYKKQVDFMDTEFNLIKRAEFKYDLPTYNINTENQADYKMSYVSGYLGKRYFYAVFLGTSWNESGRNGTCGAYLEVFDLDGNPVVRYHLEGRRPVYFAVDENTFTLYGAGEDGNPEGNLLVYKLKGL